MELDPWLLNNLVCPRDKQPVRLESEGLGCPSGHRYPLVGGIPVMLLGEVKQTHPAATYSLQQADNKHDVEMTPGVPANTDAVDAYVQHAIGGTNGIMYESVIGKLKGYPIPDLRTASSTGGYFLDVGCNWGRWCIAASRLGYNPVGIDPSLEAICAAARIARQLGVQAYYVVADARYLPFTNQLFDFIFSYSVLQHFDKGDVQLALSEVRRCLKLGGSSMIQMPNVFGLRCLYHQMRRRFRTPKNFEVRYWTLSELKSTFGSLIGPSALSVDGYFSLNPQIAEAHLLPWRYRLIIHFSEFLRRLSHRASFMACVADSLYVTAQRLD